MATPATQTRPAAAAPAKPKAPAEPTQAEKDAALLEEILNRKAVFTPFQEEKPITLTAKMVMRYFAKPTKKGFTCTEAQAEKFVMLCKTRGLNPFVGDAFIVGYDTDDGPEFNLITAHQALIKRAEAHPQFAGMSSGVIVRRAVSDGVGETIEYDGKYVEPGDTLVGGWSKVKRKDRDEPKYARIALTAFAKGFGRWKFDGAGMIVKCAQADALREMFPNQLGGLHVEEEFIGSEAREPVQMPRAVGEVAPDAPKKEAATGNATVWPGDKPRPQTPEPAFQGDGVDSTGNELTDPAEWAKQPEGNPAK
jgi:phage recombination protein Bet